MKYWFYILITIWVCGACVPSPEHVQKVDKAAPIYPDYADVTIPVNIAPLNFLLRDDALSVYVYIDNVVFYAGRGNEVTFDMEDWKAMLAKNVGKSVEVKVVAKYADGWKEYRSFRWKVVADEVDPYLTYRLIEPDYEVFNNLVLQERCVENFDVRNFSDYGMVGNRCMNCHTYASQDPSTSMFYLRGEDGGAILNVDGKLKKLELKREDMVSGSVYFGFSPSARYVVFSTNVIIPAFHAQGSKRMEVFDTKSDVYVADLTDSRFIDSPLLADSTQLETFPTFSPDGKHIYYCTAHVLDSLGGLTSLKYSLCRVAFDEENGTIGTEVDTVYNAKMMGKSVCHPRVSPDGQYLVYTVANYGTFPIWHREADLQLMNLQTGEINLMEEVNSSMSDTYHSWSSNSRWLAFASKRDDGLYGKVYYTYINKKGVCSKPFALPQAHPSFYDDCLKSFNAPEQGKGRLPFSITDVHQVLSASPTKFQ
ncbi:MAG: PD40 domain-containing protein [Bacteroidaceae bacterium]|nr:PD40 domain-containing protein [Bacteroidaceae bacterium]